MIDTYKREIEAYVSINLVQKENEVKSINGAKKLKENRKAVQQEKDLASSKRDLTKWN